MSKINDGGPAYPAQPLGSDGLPYMEASRGMSLRDWFAGQALAESTREIWSEHRYEHVAARAYAIADAMLKAREEQT